MLPSMDVHLTTGPAYFSDMGLLSRTLSGSRAGFLQLDVHLATAPQPVQVMMNRENLYIAGFRSRSTNAWYKFQGEPFGGAAPVTELPGSSNYNELGGLEFSISLASIAGIVALNTYSGSYNNAERSALRLLAVTISEAQRFATIVTNMMAVLNGYRHAFDVGTHAELIRNWRRGTAANNPGILIPHPNPA
jgi:hypothetical protein